MLELNIPKCVPPATKKNREIEIKGFSHFKSNPSRSPSTTSLLSSHRDIDTHNSQKYVSQKQNSLDDENNFFDITESDDIENQLPIQGPAQYPVHDTYA